MAGRGQDEVTYMEHEMDRRDLTDSAAIMVSLPDLSEPDWNADRSENAMRSQAFAWGKESEEQRLRFQKMVADEVQVALAGIPDVYVMDVVEARPYHIGPHADGWPLYLVRFIEDARPLLNDAALLWALGQATHSIITAARQWVGVQPRHDRAPIAISEPMLQSLVYAHAFHTYGIEGSVTLKSSYRAPFPGYGEPEHFGGGETYLIQVKSGDVTYGYVVTSYAHVAEHFRVYEGELTALPLPNWHSDDHFFMQKPHEVREVEVQPS